MHHIGVTATSHRRLTTKQIYVLRTLLHERWEPATRNQPNVNQNIFHHGSCINGDDQAGWAAHTLGSHSYYIEVHPPTNDKKRAYSYYDRLHPVRDYLLRNVDIVTVADLMITLPGTMSEVIRSGTWATTRYAFTKKKSGYIIWPDGTLESYEDYQARSA